MTVLAAIFGVAALGLGILLVRSLIRVERLLAEAIRQEPAPRAAATRPSR